MRSDRYTSGRFRLAAVIFTLAVLLATSSMAAHAARTARSSKPAGEPTPPVRVDQGASYTPYAVVSVWLLDPTAGHDQVRLSNDGEHWSEAQPWANELTWDLTDASAGGTPEQRWVTVRVQSGDGSGWAPYGSDRIMYTAEQEYAHPFQLGDEDGESRTFRVPLVNGWVYDPDGYRGSRISLDGERWSEMYELGDEWPRYLDLRTMSLGGSWNHGTRTVYRKVIDWNGDSFIGESTVKLVDMDRSMEKVQFRFPKPAITGELFTIKVVYPEDIEPPSDMHCTWTLEWGSLEGEPYDESYRHVQIQRPVTGNECDEWTFTLPWSPYLRYKWGFNIQHLVRYPEWSNTPAGQWDVTTFTAIEGTRELGIPRSSVRLAWLLPDKDIAQIGEPITYQRFTSRPIGGGDAWDPEGGTFSGNPQIDWNEGFSQEGGRTFTYTPHLPGLWVTTWHWTPPGGYKDGWTRMIFDPIVDGTKPRVTAREVERLDDPRTAGGTRYRLTWKGTDPDTIKHPRPSRAVRGSGIARFEIQSRAAGGAWATTKRVRGSLRATSVTLSVQSRTVFRIRATDRAGIRSAWSEWPAIRP